MSEPSTAGRSLSVTGLIVVVVVYLVIVQGAGLALTAGEKVEYGTFPTVSSLVRGAFIPVALSLAFGLAVATRLRWWDRILHEPLRLARWTWVFPVLMAVAILIATDYGSLGDVGLPMVVAALATTLLIGVGEELMFRGITLESVRRSPGTTELRAALLTALIFGAAHITNIFTEGPGAFAQAAIVSVSGLYFYIARRVSGGLVVPVLLHWGWDFSLFSSTLGPNPDAYALSAAAMVTNVVLGCILIVRRHAIWPKNSTAARPA